MWWNADNSLYLQNIFLQYCGFDDIHRILIFSYLVCHIAILD